MNKKAYDKPEMRERKRVIVTTMICQSSGDTTRTLKIKKRGSTDDANTQSTLINPWAAD